MRLYHFLILSGLIHLLVFPSLRLIKKPATVEIIEATFTGSAADKKVPGPIPLKVPGPISDKVALAPKKSPAAKMTSPPPNDTVSPETGPGTFSGIGPGTERAPQILKEIFVEYPKEARRARIEGDVVLKVLVNEEGHVEEATVMEPLGYGLDEAALGAMKQFLFSAGYKDGKVVKTQIKYRYKFRLD